MDVQRTRVVGAVVVGVLAIACGDDGSGNGTGGTGSTSTDSGTGPSTSGPSTTDGDSSTTNETVDDSTGEPVPPDPHVSGDLMRWHPVTFTFDGPAAAETDDAPNPFTDYRLTIHVTSPGGATFDVPGFFAADGEGGDSGDQWQARFVPDEVGVWSYEVTFRSGDGVAVDLDPDAGTPMDPEGTVGAFDITETDKTAPDFRGTGRIEYAGTHYLYTQDGNIWIKGGADSPENFLGYADFDNTVDQAGGAGTSGLMDGVHRYGPHEADWGPGDPEWADGRGHGIIGALNYLASVNVNSIYFLPCNLGGDGRETYPYIDPEDQLHFDISKLDQWEIVLGHAETLGIALHFVLAETEDGNENLHDDGQLGPERMLFYRELVARFGHHQGLFWNIGEENDYGSSRQIEFATYLRAVDPYDHPTTVHTHVDNPEGQYDGLVGDANFELSSIQLNPDNADAYTETWRTNSADAGRPWAVMLDEISPAGTGVTDTNAEDIRRRTLWPALLSGAAGVEWYFGYHDLPLGGDMRCEDFRTRESMWTYTWVARQFVQELPLENMAPDDDLLGTDGQVFAQPGEVYAVYLPQGGQTTLDLSAAAGTFELRWYDPDDGSWSMPTSVAGGQVVDLGVPAFDGDVAALLTAM